VSTVVLIRHGLTAATGPILAGHTPGVHLDERGQRQVATLGERLAPVPFAAIISSPLERCQETAEAVRGGRELEIELDDRIVECRYGDWTGQELKVLAKDPLWKVVQHHPSAAVFPGDDGEALAAVQARAVACVREHNARLGDVTYALVSHGDVIKAIVADALGIHLDLFQRIQIDPASVTVIRYTPTRPFVLHTNDTGGRIDDLLPPKGKRRRRTSDAAVGGGAGAGA
jgi:probable phosphomutase (TIGR03848 family)